MRTASVSYHHEVAIKLWTNYNLKLCKARINSRLRVVRIFELHHPVGETWAAAASYLRVHRVQTVHRIPICEPNARGLRSIP